MFLIAKKRWDQALILLAYTASYGFYRFCLGIHFDESPLRYFMQYLDPALLKADLLRSLFYLHSQPPLMNLMLGVIMKLSGDHVSIVLASLYFAVGAAALLFLDGALSLLGVRRFLRIGICVWLCVFPTFVMYANWPYTTHLEFSLSCGVIYQLAKVFQCERLTFKNGMRVFLPCTILSFLRPQWHLVFFIALLLVILRVHKASGKRTFAGGSAMMLSPIALLYFKNLLLFGFFGASSWMGMNLAEFVASVPYSGMHELVAKGEISSDFAIDFNQEKAERAHDKKGQGADMQHPSLAKLKSNGQMNYNYLPFIDAGRQDLTDALTVIRYAPHSYLSYIMTALVSTAGHPSFLVCDGPPGVTYFWNKLSCYKDWLQYSSIGFYLYCPVLLFFLLFWKRGYIAQNRPFILSLMFITLCIVVSSSTFTYGGESARMRWGSGAFYIAYLAVILEALLRSIDKRPNPFILPRSF